MKRLKQILFWTWVGATLAAWPTICLAALIYDYVHPGAVQTCACPCRVDGLSMPVEGPALRGR